jgi:hypothetical protein
MSENINQILTKHFVYHASKNTDKFAGMLEYSYVIIDSIWYNEIGEIKNVKFKKNNPHQYLLFGDIEINGEKIKIPDHIQYFTKPRDVTNNLLNGTFFDSLFNHKKDLILRILRYAILSYNMRFSKTLNVELVA